MLRGFLLSLLIISFFSCTTEKKESHLSDAKKDSVRFTFTKDTLGLTIEIKALLHNDSSDTLYILTTTCSGLQYALQYDTAKFKLYPGALCNAMFPYIEKVAPKGKVDFTTLFLCETKDTHIKLGYDLYKVDKTFDINTTDLSKILYRQDSEKNIIWAKD